jgi:glycosyltransferase involved in cell wall biosynthesis
MPVNVLHVVARMDRGGVETWLMNMLRHMDRKQFMFHFLVHGDAEAAYDSEIMRLGGKIHHGANPWQLYAYRKKFHQIVRDTGPFDVVHSHLYLFSGFVLWIANESRIPVRIAHSHTSRMTSSHQLLRRSYETLMRYAINRNATHRIGISQQAGSALFGDKSPDTYRVLYYGIDFSRFALLPSSSEAKRAIGIDHNRKVLGHIGRFVNVKNHSFIVRLLDRVRVSANAHLLLVGDGPLLVDVRRDIAKRYLADRCTFAGMQENVVPYLAAMDLLLLPSHWEGLGLTALEAQAAGLPVLASTGVPTEIDVLKDRVCHLSLKEGIEVWAQAAIRMMRTMRREESDFSRILAQSKFGLDTCVQSLSRIYSGTE